MLALVVVSVTGFSGYAALVAVAPAWAIEGGATEAGAGLVNGVLLGATVLTQTVVPRLTRSFGTGPVLVAGLLFMGLAAPAYAVSAALPVVLAVSAVRGIGFGILTVTGSTIVAHLVPADRRGEAVGVYGLAVALPMLLLMPGSVLVADRLGFGWAFAVAALPFAGIAAALNLGRRLTDADPEDDGVAPTPLDRTSVTGLIRPTVVLFAVTMTGGALMTFAPQLGFGGVIAATVLMVLGLGAAVSRWLIGRLADRHGAHRFVAPGLLICALGAGLCAWGIAQGSVALLILGALVIGPAYGALQNLTLVLAFAVVPTKRIPTASAVWNIGFDAGTASGSVIVGTLAAGVSFSAAFWVLAVVALVAIVVAPRRA